MKIKRIKTKEKHKTISERAVKKRAKNIEKRSCEK